MAGRRQSAGAVQVQVGFGQVPARCANHWMPQEDTEEQQPESLLLSIVDKLEAIDLLLGLLTNAWRNR